MWIYPVACRIVLYRTILRRLAVVEGSGVGEICLPVWASKMDQQARVHQPQQAQRAPIVGLFKPAIRYGYCKSVPTRDIPYALSNMMKSVLFNLKPLFCI